MGFYQETWRKICNGLAIATDWLLIVMGFLLVLIALKSIDVMVARYVIICGGVLLTGIGFWYRYRRLQRRKRIGR